MSALLPGRLLERGVRPLGAPLQQPGGHKARGGRGGRGLRGRHLPPRGLQQTKSVPARGSLHAPAPR